MSLHFSANSPMNAYRPAAGQAVLRFGSSSPPEDVLDRPPVSIDKTPRDVLKSLKTQIKATQAELDEDFAQAEAEYPAKLDQYRREKAAWDVKVIKWFQSPPTRPEKPKRETATVDVEALYVQMGLDIHSTADVKAMDQIFDVLKREKYVSMVEARPLVEGGITQNLMFQNYVMTLTEKGQTSTCA